ncbi:enoyl-CoA hydratase-related protein [Rhodococcus sp. ACT016]|uniref:enoyl-CoA hydratase-related protein n=1 Tax=Rhodococcus sp. ACT016 TaxID=3134808 RepID=UPI003D2A3BF2
MSAPTSVPIGGRGEVVADRHGHVLLVTINRPEARNAISAQVALGIGESLEYADATRDIRAVIVTGAGDQAFCAGQDLKEAARGVRLTDPRADRWGFAGFVKHAISKPIIAAVNGSALGGGTEIVLASDLAVAADTATLGLPEVKRGIIAAAGGAFRLSRQIPSKIALETMLTGLPISAERALQLGLVNRVVEADQVLDEAFALAELVAANAPLAVQSSKLIAHGIADGRIPAEEDDWLRTAEQMQAIRASSDAHEGVRAFVEKRAAHWQGM